jgi:TonB-dependent starch-binding outer membrane protein SusC
MRYIILLIFCGFCSAAFSQGLQVSGKVTASDDGYPMIGVNVVIEGTTEGTITDLDGNYSLQIPAGNASLIFSSVGYQSKTIQVDNRSTINVVLEEDVRGLDEVVVIGYGTQKKSDVSTSVASVKSEDLVKSASVSFDQALQGQMAGVQVMTNSGQPGGMTSVNIRGMGGLGRNEPLYVVDGVILYDYQNNIHEGRLDYGTNVSNVLSNLNPADIESIDVLKDASASAIYGSRGGNGVVIITTKSGKEGKPAISFNAKYGIQTLSKKFDLLNAEEYVAFSNDARHAAELLPYPKWSNTAGIGAGTDYQDEIFSAAPYQDYNLSISGGQKGSTYYISGSYTSQDGIINNSGFERINLKVNNDNQITNWFKMGTRVLLSQTENEIVPANIVRYALTRGPTLPVYTEDGLNYAGPGEFESGYTGRIANPVLVSEILDRNTINKNALGNIYLEFSLLKNLKFKTSVGADYLLTQNTYFDPVYTEFPTDTVQQPVNRNTTANAQASNVSKLNVLMENTLTYEKLFGKHNIHAMAGYTAQKFETDILLGESNNHISNYLTTIDAGSSNERYAEGSKRIKTYSSLLGAVRYNYDSKYYVTGNIRRDGSSVFPSGNKYGVFPSFSVAWRVTGEKFMKPYKEILSDVKIRGSWGQTGIDGNLQQNPEYAQLSMRYNAVFNNEMQTGIAPAGVINPNLHWETAHQTDIGLDIGLFNNKLLIVADYFYKAQKDIISYSLVPRMAGMTRAGYTDEVEQAENSAEALNKGFECVVTYKQSSSTINYNISANFSTFNNKITRLNEPIFLLTYNGSHLIRIQEGKPVSQFYGYQTDGIFTDQAELDALNQNAPDKIYQNVNTELGDVKFRDIAGRDEEGNIVREPDGQVDDADRTFIGNPLPDFTAGLNFSINYRAFDLSMTWSAVYGNDLYNANRVFLEGSNDQQNKLATMLNRYSEENHGGYMPRAITSDPNLNSRNSDRFIEDGSYLKLRNIEFGYTIPHVFTRKVKINNARIFISAQNLLTLTNYSGYDPDVGKYLLNDDSGLMTGFDNSFYPQARSFFAGINLKF